MNWFGSGFINIINYSVTTEAVIEEFTLETENNLDLLTENGKSILIEN